jgi:hypothetical protein
MQTAKVHTTAAVRIVTSGVQLVRIVLLEFKEIVQVIDQSSLPNLYVAVEGETARKLKLR